jgi:hypothetical protein
MFAPAVVKESTYSSVSIDACCMLNDRDATHWLIEVHIRKMLRCLNYVRPCSGEGIDLFQRKHRCMLHVK